jgi:hypothetical protein
MKLKAEQSLSQLCLSFREDSNFRENTSGSESLVETPENRNFFLQSLKIQFEFPGHEEVIDFLGTGIVPKPIRGWPLTPRLTIHCFSTVQDLSCLHYQTHCPTEM